MWIGRGVPKSMATQSVAFGEPSVVQRLVGRTWYQNWPSLILPRSDFSEVNEAEVRGK